MRSTSDWTNSLLQDPLSDPKHPARALAALADIRRAVDPPHLLQALRAATAALGADASVFAVLIPDRPAPARSFTLFACDPRFAYEQAQLGPLADHPWLRYARSHSHPGTEAEVERSNDQDRAALGLASKYGFSSCFLLPTAISHDLGRVEVLCMGSSKDHFFETEASRLARTLARSLAGELHDWFLSYSSALLREIAGLDAQDAALLAMEWQGLNAKAIARRTKLSRQAVNSRFQRLNVRLDRPNKHESARRAAEYGLFDPRKQSKQAAVRRYP